MNINNRLYGLSETFNYAAFCIEIKKNFYFSYNINKYSIQNYTGYEGGGYGVPSGMRLYEDMEPVITGDCYIPH